MLGNGGGKKIKAALWNGTEDRQGKTAGGENGPQEETIPNKRKRRSEAAEKETRRGT